MGWPIPSSGTAGWCSAPRSTGGYRRCRSRCTALHRADRPLWTYQVGAQPRTRFRPGSVTKTFTAVLVLQCRDDGLLDLDDPIGRHLDLPRHGELAVRRPPAPTPGRAPGTVGDQGDPPDGPA